MSLKQMQILDGAVAVKPEQEPVAWLLTDKNINSLQVDSIQRLIDRLKHAHHTDLCVRINGQDEWFEADWLKHMVRVTPPQRTEQEPVAWMFQHEETGRTMCVDSQQVEWGFEKSNPRLKKIAPLYTTPPQRTWVGLTDEEIGTIAYNVNPLDGIRQFSRAIEAKLKEKNT